MELIPAIDLLGGRVVRLAQGDYAATTGYADDAVAVARRWEQEGAQRIHIVDLEAARAGGAPQSAIVAAIVRSVGIACQVAGGLRDEQSVRRALESGVDRVVLGSALIDRPALAGRLVEAWGTERIVAAIDVRDGQALGDGWVAGARGSDALGHAETLASQGIRWMVVTAIVRDGGMAGPDLDLLEAVRARVPGTSIIASGGVSSLADIRELAGRGFAAAITGRALYEGAFSLPEALAAAGD